MKTHLRTNLRGKAAGYVRQAASVHYPGVKDDEGNFEADLQEQMLANDGEGYRGAHWNDAAFVQVCAAEGAALSCYKCCLWLLWHNR